MNVKAFRAAREEFFEKIPFSDPSEYRKAWDKLRSAAAPEHVPEAQSEFFSDQVLCSCGWESRGYWDLIEAGWGEWREHVADEMGLLPKECPCGKEYVPADGGTACHKLQEIE